jgi:hypothetical protein
MESERIARAGVVFFHRMVNQYLRVGKYSAFGHEHDKSLTATRHRESVGACGSAVAEGSAESQSGVPEVHLVEDTASTQEQANVEFKSR